MLPVPCLFVLQAREAARVREAGDLKKAKMQGDIAKLQQQLSALEEAREVQKAALQLQLEKEKLAKEVELQVRKRMFIEFQPWLGWSGCVGTCRVSAEIRHMIDCPASAIAG
jgi:predicted nuclease with TOPRIM domain